LLSSKKYRTIIDKLFNN